MRTAFLMLYAQLHLTIKNLRKIIGKFTHAKRRHKKPYSILFK